MERYRTAQNDENNNFDKEEAYLRAEKKLKNLKGFYWHLFWYLVVNIFLWISIYNNLDADESFFQYEHFFTAFFWGIGLGFHALSVFGKNFIFSKDWEDRKMKDYMKKEEQFWE